MKVRALVFFNHPAYEFLAENAIRSFINWHPDIKIHVFTDKTCAEKFRLLPPGVQKTIHAEHLMRSENLDKLIILGADTIVTGRLDEFLNSDEDILHTLDYWGKHPLGYDSPQVNADVVCINNVEAIQYINQLALKAAGPYYEQGSQNMALYGMPKVMPIDANLRDMRPHTFQQLEKKRETDVKNHILENGDRFTHKIIDSYETGVVYNARSKQLLDEKDSQESFEKNIKNFKVEDGGKLFTQDGRHIKVFHFCEGIGARRTNANFRSVVEKYLNWFNPETVDFFTDICKCSNIIKERKYPKWRLEDKFEFDEYTLHIAEQAGAEVRTKAENNK